MMGLANDNLIAAEAARPDRFGRQEYIDIHCHCLPDIDDGPATEAEALGLCQELVYDGIAHVIATPHQLGRFNDCNDAKRVREKVFALNEQLQSRSISIAVAPGGDVRVDERICQLLEADKILTLADGGKYILLELPHEVFIDIEPLLVDLASLDIQAIISHPERHSVLAKGPRAILKWLEQPAYMQVTCASLLGEFGAPVEQAAWRFLDSGWASFVATDSHDLDGRRPRMRAAFERISIRLGEAIARLVCIENPLRVLKGQNIQTIHSMKAEKRINETARSNS